MTVVVGDEDGTADPVTLGSEEVLGAALASTEGFSDGLEVVVGLWLVVGIELGITVVVGDDDGAPDEATVGAEEVLGTEEVLGARLVSFDGTEDGLKDTVGL